MLSSPALVFAVVFTLVAGLLALPERRRARQARRALARLAAPLPSGPAAPGAGFRKSEALSRLPWLHDLLARNSLFHRLGLLLLQAGLNWTVARFLLTAVVCGVTVFLAAGARLPAALAAVFASAAPLVYVLARRRRRFSAFERQLAQQLEMVAGALKVGHALGSAMNLAAAESAEPLAGEFRQCVEEQRLGLDLRIALAHLAERMPLQDLRVFTTACTVQRETGGNLAEILERAAHVIRERFRVRQQIRVHTAQAKLTGIALVLLPVGLGAVLSILNPSQMSVLFTTLAGRTMLAAAGGLLLVGGFLIRCIIRVRL